MEGIRVLLVEDDFAAQELMTAFFRTAPGITLVETAGDGETGLEAIRRCRPDLVLLDLVLPRLSGLGVLRTLAEEAPEDRPRVLVLSRVSSEAVIQRCLELGADFYLLKPVNLTDLGALITDLCARTRAESPAGRYLRAMGGNPDALGYHYACVIAQTLADAPPGTLLKEGYYRAAELGETSYECVEKNVRELVGRLYRADRPAWRALWDKPPAARPANGAFLRRLARLIQSGEG